MSDTPDGLASLAAQRERARRSMPAPRHPVTAKHPAGVKPATSDSPAVSEAAASPAAARPEAARTAPPAEVGAPIKVTLYVDRDTDEFMEAARVEGLTGRPKVDVSRSAVVRLALRRLMDDMSPAEVKTLLADQVVRSTGPGRKRR